MRKELLYAYLFYTLDEVRLLAEGWRMDYNHERPHKALGFVPPAEYFLIRFPRIIKQQKL